MFKERIEQALSKTQFPGMLSDFATNQCQHKLQRITSGEEGMNNPNRVFLQEVRIRTNKKAKEYFQEYDNWKEIDDISLCLAGTSLDVQMFGSIGNTYIDFVPVPDVIWYSDARRLAF